MKLEHSFTVPAPVDEAWAVLRDVERIAPCMPGTTIESVDGDTFTGKVKVKVGPITVTYRGDARFVDVDDATHSATIEAQGKEARGSGTARAVVTMGLQGQDGETAVAISTELTITGKPAQFGRDVMADVGAKLVGQFAECLSNELGSTQAAPGEGAPAPAAAAAEAVTTEPAVPEEAPESAAAEAAAPAPSQTAATGNGSRPTADVIDLFDVAGPSVAKRLAPVAGVLALLAILAYLLRRRRS